MFAPIGRFNMQIKKPMLDRAGKGFSKVNAKHLLLDGEIDREY
jgi:hypothetical protein